MTGALDNTEVFLKHLNFNSASFTAVFAVFLLYLIVVEGRRKLMYYRIPSAGCGNDPLTSFRAATRFKTDCKSLIQEGYDEFKGGIFKLAMADGWVVMVTGKEHIQELWSAPEWKLNFHKAVDETTKSRFSFGAAVTENAYHVGILRGRLTRSIPELFPELLDEVVCSFNDEFQPSTEWKTFSPIPHIRRIVCRASNRIFVGLPMCRDPSYVRLNTEYTLEVWYAQQTLNSYPAFLQSVIGRYITNIGTRTKEAFDLLTPIIQERLSILACSNTDYSQLPNDLLTWLIIDTDKKGRNVLELCQRLLVVNFGAIHGTTNTFVHLLFRLAANPDWVEILREEVENATEVDGWTKTAFDKMHKLDSILREGLRVDGVNLWSLIRVAMEDYTFSNGVAVPKGALLAAPTSALHTDGSTEQIIGDQPADVFDPWRFSRSCRSNSDGKLLEGLDTHSTPVPATTTSWDYLPFGHGKMSCPGRIFAGTELKLMIAHFIQHYDVKLENGCSGKPPNVYIGYSCAPNQQASVMVKARRNV